MLRYKITGIAIVLLSKVLFAGTMGAMDLTPICVPGSSIIPCVTNAWDISASALYLKPKYGDKLVYLGVFHDQNLSHNIAKKSREWDWGYKIEASYHYSTGSDLNINWSHFNQSITNNTTFTVGSFGIALPLTYTIKPKWNSLNLEYGQIVNYGENRSFRFYGGLQTTELDSDALLNLPPIFIGGITRYVSASGDIKYHSIGPRVGLDYYSNFLGNFGIYADAAITVLFGNGQFHRTSFINDIVLSYKSGSRNLVLPEFEGKIGAQFIFLMGRSYLSFNAGYMLVDFLSGTDSLSTKGFGDIFSLSGVYIGVKWADSL
ncbi:Lpg1974 family pore-forming outer membrane protein [Legionella gresilensis]|uniref:Lpg1974 family pore-forming outer membrane protein n=1 Tax=Legionella gresilensis TaxID=91823 RepID=UPI0010419CE0|nr:Lpg1974 family pore-forming outer membrane protein [Legionella gresilensis]